MPEEQLYKLEIESLDLGPGVRAVGLELLNPETREPVTGGDAAPIWAAVLTALAAQEPWGLDFFAHVNRVRDYSELHGVAFSEPNSHVLLVPSPAPEKLPALIERFAGSIFGVRAGKALLSGDAAVEGALAANGVDAYQPAFANYVFCAVCDFENGFLTLLSEHLWASEVIRRSNAALSGLQVDVTRPA